MTLAETLSDFLAAAAHKLEQDHAQIVRCAALLEDAQLWSRANNHCNSVGNLILHLNGNVGQWILAGIGGQSFHRDRPAEFAQRGPLPRAEILDALRQTVEKAAAIIRGLTPPELTRPRLIQGYRVSTLNAVFHVAEHFSFHTGQIVHIAKTLRDVDLSLYDEQGRRRHAPADQPW